MRAEVDTAPKTEGSRGHQRGQGLTEGEMEPLMAGED